MAWTPFTLEDCGLSAPELAAIQLRLPSGRAQSIVGGVIATIRSAAGASGPIDSTDGSLPPELRNECAAISRHLLSLELPTIIGTRDQADARKAAHDTALARLKDLAAGRLPISRPDPGEGQPTNTFSPRYTGREPRFSGAHQDGI